MKDIYYVFIPASLALIMEFFVPYMRTLKVDEVFLSPHYIFHAIMFLATYILLGIVLSQSRELENNDIFIFAWISVFLNLIWSYYINRNNKYAIIFLFLALMFGYFIYNEIFLSPLTDNGQTLYLNLMTAYIVWIGFMIALVFQYEQIHGKRRVKKKSKKPV